ncbi:hypothetical protein FACS1894204_04220 [Synergistales bacterium]|nr:hypothetical protein FACS1894204_04220 [Synergistales bacterium]
MYISEIDRLNLKKYGSAKAVRSLSETDEKDTSYRIPDDMETIVKLLHAVYMGVQNE